MTDETVMPDNQEQAQPNMISEEQLKGRLAQQARHHEKAMSDVQSQIADLKSRLWAQPSVGEQAAQNVVQSAHQYAPQQMAQPSLDINELANRVVQAQQQSDAAQKEAAKQQEMQNTLQGQRQQVIGDINSSQEQDPEFKEMLNNPETQINGDHIVDDLYGEAMPGGVLKQLISTKELRDDYNNAPNHLARRAVVRRASNILGTQVAATNMSRGANNRIPAQRGSSSDNIHNQSTPSDLRAYYKSKNLL